MKRILIIYTSAGNGHKSAAYALKDAFDYLYKDKVVVRTVDALDYTHLIFKEVYSKSYFAMANYAPYLWGLLYYQTDKNKKIRKNISKKAVTAFDKLNAIKLSGLVKEFQPDHIISTHFFPVEVLSSAKSGKNITHSVVVTDYEVHNFWIRKGVFSYFVASPEARCMMNYRDKVPLDKVIVSGIPIPLNFLKKGYPVKFLKSKGLNPRHKTVLVLSGGMGIGDMTEYVQSLQTVGLNLNVICVVGKNKRLYKKLGKLSLGANIRKVVTGFVDNMNEYIEAADLVITKPGGLTVSECLAMITPMMLVLPIPGQEDANTDFLLENGVALRARNICSFKVKLKHLLKNESKLARMKQNAKRISKPNAALDIAQKVYSLKGGQSENRTRE